MKSQHTKQAHLQTTQADTQTKVCKRACFSPTQSKIVFKNFPTLKKNKNTPTHSPTKTADNDKETQY